MGAFAPVRDIKNRHKCVTLAFEASVKALSDKA
jgi:NifU-like protein involved in Fe-S cluster formation